MMKLTEIIEELDLSVLAGADVLDREVNSGYVSDMLSDVLANAEKGAIWVTIQRHLNVIAIAGIKEIAAVVLVNGRRPDDETLEQANAEKLPILGSDLKAFEVVGRLYQLGVRG